MTVLPLDDVCKDRLREYGIEDQKLCDLACFSPGETVIREGDEIHQLYLIVEGKVRIYSVLPSGKELTLMYHESKGVLGDWEFLSGNHTASATSVAETPVRCIRVSYKEKLINNVGFVRRIASDSIERARRVSNNYVSAALQPSEKQVCAYILNSYPNGMILDYLTSMSKATGVSYRHLLRIIHKLCSEGILEKSERGYRITDLERLKAYSY